MKFTNESLFPPHPSATPPLARTPPVDLIHGARPAKWTPPPPVLPVRLSLSPFHADTHPCQCRTPPRHPRQRCRRSIKPGELLQARVDLPQTPFASLLSVLAYKYHPRLSLMHVRLLCSSAITTLAASSAPPSKGPLHPCIAPAEDPLTFIELQWSSSRASPKSSKTCGTY